MQINKVLKIWPHLTFGLPFTYISFSIHERQSKLYIVERRFRLSRTKIDLTLTWQFPSVMEDELLQSDSSSSSDFRFDGCPVTSEEGHKRDLKSRPPLQCRPELNHPQSAWNFPHGNLSCQLKGEGSGSVVTNWSTVVNNRSYFVTYFVNFRGGVDSGDIFRSWEQMTVLGAAYFLFLLQTRKNCNQISFIASRGIRLQNCISLLIIKHVHIKLLLMFPRLHKYCCLTLISRKNDDRFNLFSSLITSFSFFVRLDLSGFALLSIPAISGLSTAASLVDNFSQAWSVAMM